MPLKAKIEGREMDISVKFPEAALTDLKSLQEELIQTQGGEFLRLKEISTLEEQPIAGSIDREDQQFEQTLMWEFRGPYKAAERYKEAIFNKLELPPGFSATLEGYSWRMTEEELGEIRFAIIFSIIIIFMILASLYESFIQPFFILLAVPLALIGVFVAFVIADFPFDSSAYIGVILLGGIVVNNSILLVDHINLLGENPLRGPNIDKLGPRFPDMCDVYDPNLVELTEVIAVEEKITVRKGVYVAVPGPNLETRAEYRFLRIIGADAVGMSTVPEVIAARYLGMDVLGISMVTNMAAGILDKPLSHREVVETAAQVIPMLSALLKGILTRVCR